MPARPAARKGSTQRVTTFRGIPQVVGPRRTGFHSTTSRTICSRQQHQAGNCPRMAKPFTAQLSRFGTEWIIY